MAYDWKRLEREDDERSDYAARNVGLSFVILGIIGPVVGFLITGSYNWASALIWIVLGLAALIPGWFALRRARRAGRPAR